jgi:hypothetical protein
MDSNLLYRAEFVSLSTTSTKNWLLVQNSSSWILEIASVWMVTDVTLLLVSTAAQFKVLMF